jgi:hypothetical protein
MTAAPSPESPAANPLPAGLEQDVEARLRRELDFSLTHLEEVDPGVIHNNRLVRLRASDGRQAMAKVYLQDGRQRLEREFDTLAFLRRRGLRSVPAALARSDEHYYAVYSLEEGHNRPAAEWTEDQAVAAAHFAAELDCIPPEEADGPLPTAFNGSFSQVERIERIRARLRLFGDYVSSVPSLGALPTEVRTLLARLDPLAEVERLLHRATGRLSPAQLEERVPEHRWRLNVGDYAPHNVLIRPPNYPDGPLCILDLEYAGWDDPVIMPALFVTAEQSLAMPRPHLDALLRTFREATGLSSDEDARMQRAIALIHVMWCAVHLQLMVPALIEKKRFASPNLDVSAHLQDQADKFLRRIELAGENVDRIA